MIVTRYKKVVFGLSIPFLIILSFVSCMGDDKPRFDFIINDPNLSIELIAEQPDIATPIGMAIDMDDAIYVLESHTHTPSDDYDGPRFDKIKKSMDVDGNGIPEDWIVFADSIEDGMNLMYQKEYGLFLTTKNGVFLFTDEDGDGKSDSKKSLVGMVEPKDVYDHAGLLGITIGEDDWLYISRGNVGGKPWTIQGNDGSQIKGYGDGGNVFRCKVDGTQLEEIATGFWNPFDLKFTNEGRLLVTDNDPDSRGPNRLIEVIPGGNYGYKSVYGGSGIHPFSSWNSELPGTLPFAAPLGEAPCALLDAGRTNFGDFYSSQILVNIWEENNIVSIPMKERSSSVVGKPKVLIQGDKFFHPVALATNSHGDLYITDWVLRQYPNHGKGRIWRVTSNAKTSKSTSRSRINRFKRDTRSVDQLVDDLAKKDVFELAITRYHLSKKAKFETLSPLLKNDDGHLRLQILLTLSNMEKILDKSSLFPLLRDGNPAVQRMAMVYIGEKGIVEMEQELNGLLQKNEIDSELFETFLETIKQLQPAFVDGIKNRSGRSSIIPRRLPKSYIEDILKNPDMGEQVKAMALPFLEDFSANESLIVKLLKNSKEEKFQMALINAIRQMNSMEYTHLLKNIAFDPDFGSGVRSRALLELMYHPEKYFKEALEILDENVDALQYAAIKYLCQSKKEPLISEQVNQWIVGNSNTISATILSVWESCNTTAMKSKSDQEWYQSIDQNGSPELGALVFNNKSGLCITCHKVKGWGGDFGPELSKVGSSKSKLQLARAILEPSKEISPEWQGWFLVDEHGTKHTGRQIDVKLNSAELMNIQGDFDTFRNPRSFGVMEESLMPEGLENTMTLLEFSHLVSYLSELK